MRKFLWVVAVAGLVLTLAAPAIALDFKFGGQYRIRFYSGDNVGGNSPAGLFDHNNPDRNVGGIQLRVRPRFEVSDDNGNITANLTLEIGDIQWGQGGGASAPTNPSGTTAAIQGTARVGNGAGGGIGNDGVNVETKHAYIDALLPFGIPARLRAGIQPWFLPKGMIVDDDVVGLRAYGTTKPISYEIGWFRLARAAGITQDNSFDELQLRLDYAAATWLNAGIYGLYGMNKAATNPTPSDNYFIGFTATGKIGIVSYDLDFIYGAANGSPAGATLNDAGTEFKDMKGYAVDGGVHFPIGPVTLHLVGSFATGDKRDGGDSEAFPSLSPSWNGAGGLYELIGSGGTFDALDMVQDAPTNIWMAGFGAEYRPVKALWTRFMYGYAGFHKSKGNCAVVTSPATTCLGPSYAFLSNNVAGRAVQKNAAAGLGHEFSFRADYSVWTGFTVQGAVGFLIPVHGTTASEYVLQLLYSF